MKRIVALTVAALIFIFAAVPAFAAKDKNPSPTVPKEYKVVVHNNNGGTGTYTTEIDKDGKHVTLVAHPKNGYEFVGWKIKGKYDLEVGTLSDEQIVLLLHSDIEATPIFKKIGSSSGSSSGSTTSISMNSSQTSPQTSDGNSLFFFIVFIVLFVFVTGALGFKLAKTKR